MKKFKRLTAWLLALMMLLPTIAYALENTEEARPATYVDASQTLTETLEIVTSMMSEDLDEDVVKVLRGATMSLLEVQVGFMTLADDGGDRDLFEENGPTVFEFSVEPEYIEDLDYIAGYDISREDSYIRIESEAFDPETREQFDYLRFEVARREDTGETMLLFTIYDISGLMTSSSRYLVYQSEDGTQLLFSRTFGEVLEYRIDLNEWAKGTDYTWGKELLYPAK